MSNGQIQAATYPVIVRLAKWAITYGVASLGAIVGYEMTETAWIAGVSAFVGASLSWCLGRLWFKLKGARP